MALKLNLKASSKVGTLANTTPEEATRIATQFRAAARELDDMEANVKLIRAELLRVVEEYRSERLRKGIGDSSINIPTDDGNKVMVVYPEKYKGLEVSNIAPLKESFGENYSLFVEEVEEVKVREGVTFEAIKKLCGDNPAVAALFEVTHSVKPRKGSLAQVADLYGKGRTALAEDLLTFVDATIGTPTVRK